MNSGLRDPLTFTPALKDYIWGGNSLGKVLGRKIPPGTAESWEISAHPAGVVTVDANWGSALAGRSLPSLVAEFGTELVGRRGQDAVARGDFPLLVKVLDAAQRLSIQVHPNDLQVARMGTGESGKTEMWHILHAEPGAAVLCGLAGDSSADDCANPDGFRQAVLERRVAECLARVPVSQGDSVLVTAGTVHAILEGVVLVEVQQSSDITYRIYDWERGRDLHLDRALEVIDFGVATGTEGLGAGVQQPRWVEDTRANGVSREVVAECEKFVVERLTFTPGSRWEGHLEGESCEIWGTLEGSLAVDRPGNKDGRAVPSLNLPAVRFALLPATMGDCLLRANAGSAVALRIYLPAT